MRPRRQIECKKHKCVVDAVPVSDTNKGVPDGGWVLLAFLHVSVSRALHHEPFVLESARCPHFLHYGS